MIKGYYRIKPLKGISIDKAVENVTTGMSIGTEQIAVHDSCEKWPSLRGKEPKKYLAEVSKLENDIFEICLDDSLIDWEYGPFTQLLSFFLGDTFGKAYDVQEIELIDLELSEELFKHFPACKYGVDGIHKLLGVGDRPLFSLLMKPNTGRPVEYYTDLAYQAALGGVDYIKEDELLFSPPGCKIIDRVKAIRESMERSANTTGYKALHGINITGSAANVLPMAKEVFNAGASATMMTACYVGFDGVQSVTKNVDLPVHLHRAGHDVLVNGVKGLDLTVFTKLMKLSGADIIHVGCPEGNIHPPEKVKKNFEILQNWGNGNPLAVVSRCTSESIERNCEFFGSDRLMFLFDKGIYGEGKDGDITKNSLAIRKKLESMPL